MKKLLTVVLVLCLFGVVITAKPLSNSSVTGSFVVDGSLCYADRWSTNAVLHADVTNQRLLWR